jgi:hypothetical protein
LLTPDNVINYLREMFWGFNLSEAEVAADSTIIDGLVCFWRWVMDWNESAAFINQHSISQSPPTSDRTSDYQEDVEPDLGVQACRQSRRRIRSYIGLLANSFVVDKLIGLRAQDNFTIHQSLYEAQLAIKSTLSSSENAHLCWCVNTGTWNSEAHRYGSRVVSVV